MSIIVEELYAVLGIKTDEASMAKATNALLGLRNGIMGIAGIAAGAFGALASMATSTARVGDEASALSERLGISTENLQKLQFVAEMCDTTTESLATGLKFLGRNAVEASQGSEAMGAAFARAGVSIRDADGMIRPTDKLFEDLAEKFAAMPNGAEKTSLALKLLGRSGDQLIPTLNRGKAGIAALKLEAVELGLVLSDDVIKSSEAFDDSSKRMQASLRGLTYTIGGPLIESFNELLGPVTKWIKENRKIIAMPIIKFFKMLAGALKWLSGESDGALFAMGAIKTGLIGLGVVLAAYTAASIAAAIATGAAWLLASAPIIALGLAIGLVAEDLAVFAAGGDSALGQLINWFNKIGNDNAVVALLKSLGAVLFDLSDPAKWRRVVEAGVQAAREIAAAFKSILVHAITGEYSPGDQLSAFGKAAGGSNPLVADALKMIAGATGYGGAMGVPSIAPTTSSSTTKSTTTTNVIRSPVTMNVNGGNPEEIKRAIEDHNNAQLGHANAAYGK